MAGLTLETIVSAFGQAAKAKLSNPAISGSPEDQLRGPLETLFSGIANLCGLPPNALSLVGETRMADIKTRPDYAVTVRNALIGFIEVKAPGKGADPRRFSDPHDKDQWSKLKSLPNLLYTDGNAFSLWRDGLLIGSILRLDGDIESSGNKLAASDALTALFSDFFGSRFRRKPRGGLRRSVRGSAACCATRSPSNSNAKARRSPGLPPTGASSCSRRPTTRLSPMATRRP